MATSDPLLLQFCFIAGIYPGRLLLSSSSCRQQNDIQHDVDFNLSTYPRCDERNDKRDFIVELNLFS